MRDFHLKLLHASLRRGSRRFSHGQHFHEKGSVGHPGSLYRYSGTLNSHTSLEARSISSL